MRKIEEGIVQVLTETGTAFSGRDGVSAGVEQGMPRV